MRKVGLFLGLSLFLCGISKGAGVPVVEAPINGYGTPVTISISSTTLTKIPTSQTSGRFGIYVNNPSTRPVAGFFGDCSSTALAATIRPIQFSLTTVNTGPSDVRYFSMREDVCLWLISIITDTGSQSIHYQEVKQ